MAVGDIWVAEVGAIARGQGRTYLHYRVREEGGQLPTKEKMELAFYVKHGQGNGISLMWQQGDNVHGYVRCYPHGTVPAGPSFTLHVAGDHPDIPKMHPCVSLLARLGGVSLRTGDQAGLRYFPCPSRLLHPHGNVPVSPDLTAWKDSLAVALTSVFPDEGIVWEPVFRRNSSSPWVLVTAPSVRPLAAVVRRRKYL